MPRAFCFLKSEGVIRYNDSVAAITASEHTQHHRVFLSVGDGYLPVWKFGLNKSDSDSLSLEMCLRLQPLQMLGLHLYRIIIQHLSIYLQHSCRRALDLLTTKPPWEGLWQSETLSVSPVFGLMRACFCLLWVLPALNPVPTCHILHQSVTSVLPPAAIQPSFQRFHINCLHLSPIRLFDP